MENTQVLLYSESEKCMVATLHHPAPGHLWLPKASSSRRYDTRNKKPMEGFSDLAAPPIPIKTVILFTPLTQALPTPWL